ncbi:uncharacterized protein LOC129728278 [Wyeomyia smithii]|uniref:uncharacterized protein LOC129728278 n=1 Tax=Wyeomyia smithii TaxID=174621 RepID=UPI0024680C9E|nr:uncharacterized protein LOC129728278 [Wyeomyia smithii]
MVTSSRVHSTIPTLNEKAILNATDTEIPEEVTTLLSLSPKFSLYPHNFPHNQLYHLLAETESILKTNFKHQIQDTTRCMITNCINNFIHKYDNCPRDPESKFIRIAQTKTRNFLKLNPNICILSADKGNRTVVKLTEEYNRKMKLLLNDTNTYKTVKSDPTNKFQTANNNIIGRLLELKLIDKQTAYNLKTYTATCPRIYGQPKAHKQNLPLRPVVPGMTSPSYNLSKYVCKIYQMSIQTKYNVRDIVISLFTSIPKELIIRDTINSWGSLRTNTNINLDLFLEIVNFCLDSSYFMFRDQYYSQIAGAAMGNPLSPILSDLIMEPLIDSVLRNICFPVHTIRKYVHDLFLIIPKDKKNEILTAFNSYHSDIQFTIEEEQNGRLAYLDMTLIRQADNSIRTEYYTKTIASGRLLNYRSIHPLSLKINIASNFISRVNDLSTNLTDTQKRNIIVQQLKLNDYPLSLINRCWNRMKTAKNIQTTHNTPAAERIYRSIPYIPMLTPHIVRILKQQYPEVCVSTRCTHTVRKFFIQIKDPVPALLKHNVIYKIPCSNCDKSYIGMTSNLLKSRLSNHQSNINKLDQLLNSGLPYTDPAIRSLREKTALISHCIDERHRFNLTETKILDFTHRKSSLSLLEMVWIYNDTSTVNKRTDVDGLNATFAGILHAIDKHRNKQQQIVNSIN